MADETGKDKDQHKTVTLVQAIIAGVFTLLGAMGTVVYQGYYNLELKKEEFKGNLELKQREFESDIILKAIETGDPQTSAKNLAFFINVGVIRGNKEQEEKIKAILVDLQKTPEKSPVLPPKLSTENISKNLRGRVYMSAPNDMEDNIVSKLKIQMEKLDYTVIINTRKTGERQSKAVISYYYPDDEREATTLIETLESTGIAVDPNPRLVRGTARPRHFDLRL